MGNHYFTPKLSMKHYRELTGIHSRHALINSRVHFKQTASHFCSSLLHLGQTRASYLDIVTNWSVCDNSLEKRNFLWKKKVQRLLLLKLPLACNVVKYCKFHFFPQNANVGYNKQNTTVTNIGMQNPSGKSLLWQTNKFNVTDYNFYCAWKKANRRSSKISAKVHNTCPDIPVVVGADQDALFSWHRGHKTPLYASLEFLAFLDLICIGSGTKRGTHGALYCGTLSFSAIRLCIM